MYSVLSNVYKICRDLCQLRAGDVEGNQVCHFRLIARLLLYSHDSIVRVNTAEFLVGGEYILRQGSDQCTVCTTYYTYRFDARYGTTISTERLFFLKLKKMLVFSPWGVAFLVCTFIE